MNKRDNTNTFKRMVKSIAIYKKYFYSAVVVSVLLALLESLPPQMYSWAIDNIIIGDEYSKLVYFGVIFLALVIAVGLLNYLFVYFAGKLELIFTRNLRSDLFKKVQMLPMQFFDDNQDGWTIAKLTSDVSKLAEVMSWQFINSAYLILMMSISIGVIFFYGFKSGIVVLILYPLLLLIIYLIKNLILKEYRKVRRLNSNLISKFNEMINGILTIKTMNINQGNYDEFESENVKFRKFSRRTTILSGFFVPIILIFGYGILEIVLKISVSDYLIGNLTVGEMSAVLGYMIILMELTTELTSILSELQNAQANAERIFDLLDLEIELIDTPEVIEKYGTVIDDVLVKEPIIGNLEFKNVVFKYKSGNTIFDNFNLTVPAGTSVALVGDTGSGKTTFVNLLSRFYEPQEGEILIDGLDIKSRSINWLHQNIGHVLQDPFLFNGTVRENIRYNFDITDSRIDEVCELVGLNDLILNLDSGLDTNVGESGSKLSVGEKQLISFARAVANDPHLFILDEATSSIDSRSEKLIQDAIENIMTGRTTIIIAHRLSTIKKCDLIVCMKHGEIVESGSHEELMDLHGYYYDLYNANLKV